MLRTYLLCNSILIVVIQYFGCKNEQIFYVFASLCRRLETEKDAAISLELFDSIRCDLALLLLIFFISNKEKYHVRLTLRHHFIIPCRQIIECFQACYIVGQKYAMRSPIEYFRYALETLLARSVPNLQLEDLLLELDKECSELDAYGDLVIGHKLVVRQPM